MSDRDRQSNYDQHGSRGQTGFGGSSGQASQWQADESRQQGGGWQQGGDWQQDSQRGGDEHTRDYRFSGQGGSRDETQGYGRAGAGSHGRARGSSSGGYWSESSDNDWRNDQRDSYRDADRARGNYGQHNDRNQSYGQQRSGAQGSYGAYGSQGRYGAEGQSDQRSDTGAYAGRDFDASGGNNFANFTGDDFGGRDFYNRGGGAGAGLRSSESYRPSYGLASWLGSDDDQGRGSQNGGEDYGDWRKYGESRGFLQRAGDEVASWFGDEDASRRRERDHRQSAGQHGSSLGGAQSHRGRGPSNYTRSDERIREDANDHLTHDHHVDASHITVSVKDGELTLEGTVDSRNAKRRAEDCVDHISGVKHVQNNLRVQDRSSNASQYGSSNRGAGVVDSAPPDSSAGSTASRPTAGSGSTLGGGATSGAAGSGTTLGQTSASTTGGLGSASTTPSSTKTS